ncbi:MAG TPA: hypothetical protein VJS12_02255 [Steroidobacteraceae bacterium]|nr:hypothetical protein [Steroidobacteraceae bacterium]
MSNGTLIFILASLLGAAPALAREAPESFPAVVYGHFTRGEELPEPDDDDCDGAEHREIDEQGNEHSSICISGSSPLLLEFEVSGVVYGTIAEKRLRVITTSHYGLRSFSLGEDVPVVILLDGRTDGVYSMPAYALEDIDPSTDGDWAIALARTRGIFWLPCSVQEHLERIEWSHAVRVELANFPAETLEARKLYLEVDGPWVYFTHGLRLRRLKTELERVQLSENSTRCEDEE